VHKLFAPVEYINQSINQFNSVDVAHTRTRETDEQTEAADRKNSTRTAHILVLTIQHNDVRIQKTLTVGTTVQHTSVFQVSLEDILLPPSHEQLAPHSQVAPPIAFLMTKLARAK